MTKKKLATKDVIERLAQELSRARDNEKWELVPGIAWDLLMKSLLYALRIKKQPVRPTWPQLRKKVPAIGAASDYTALFETVRDLEKKERYSEGEEEEFDPDALSEIVDEVLEFVEQVRNLAKQASKTS
jgi:uncharacterized protein (UPF0305 family)